MDTLNHLLDALSLSAIKSCYAEVAEQAGREGLDYAAFLTELLTREYEERETERITRRLRESRLPLEKSFANLECARFPRRLRERIALIQTGEFMTRRENILVFGTPGAGKTHLLCALGQELIRKGYRVYFRSCALLIQELLKAKRDLTLPRLLQRLGRYDTLVLDDLGYVKYTREEMEVFFTLLADRYERSSILLTSNQPFSKWESIFLDPMTAAAAIDRLIHHSIIVEMNLPSYRVEEARNRQKESEEMSPGEDVGESQVSSVSQDVTA